MHRVNIHTRGGLIRTNLTDDRLADVLNRVAQDHGVVTVDVTAQDGPGLHATKTHIRVQAITHVEEVLG